MNKPRISLIAALSENRVIGNKGEIPWHIPGEQKRFKEITMGHPIIMGRKTYESIGKPLPGRTNIIITSDSSYKANGTIVVHSLDEGIEKAKAIELSHSGAEQRGAIESKRDPIVASQPLQDDNYGEVFVIGGGKVFDDAINLADKLYLTIIHKEIEGDAFFPDYSAFKKVVYKEDKEVGEYTFTYLDLMRE